MNLNRFLGLAMALLLLPAVNAWADDYTDTIKIFQNAGESGTFSAMPTAMRSSDHWQGWYRRRRCAWQGPGLRAGRHIGDTSMTQVTIGFQLGGQAFSQIVFFEDKRALGEFTGGNFEFGAQAQAVAITAAAGATAPRQAPPLCQRRQERCGHRGQVPQGHGWCSPWPKAA